MKAKITINCDDMEMLVETMQSITRLLCKEDGPDKHLGVKTKMHGGNQFSDFKVVLKSTSLDASKSKVERLPVEWQSVFAVPDHSD